MAILTNSSCALVATTQNESLVRHWARALEDICEIFNASTVEELQQHLNEYRPSVVLLDIDLPGLNLHTHLAELLRISPTTKTVVFSNEYDEEEAISVIKSGAKGYAQKNSDVLLLRKSVEVIRKGELWIPRYLVTMLLAQMQENWQRERSTPGNGPKYSVPFNGTMPRLEQLTKREHQIAELIASGNSNKEIAALLKISESTVKAHLSAIYHKLGLLDRLSLALFVTHQSHSVAEPAEVE